VRYDALTPPIASVDPGLEPTLGDLRAESCPSDRATPLVQSACRVGRAALGDRRARCSAGCVADDLTVAEATAATTITAAIRGTAP
jgi:hypothetical protein